MYNVEKYLSDTLDSVLGQTFQNYEVIIVNDCSTDNSRQIAEGYLKKFGGRLKIYDNEKNSGVSATRNRGLNLSTGEYIFFLDADDLLAPNALTDMYEIAEKFGADTLNCMGSCTVSEDYKEMTFSEEKAPIISEGESLSEEDLKWRINNILRPRFTSGPWRKFCKRDFLIRNKLFFLENIRYAEDHIWTYGVFLSAKKVVHVQRVFYYIRLSANSLGRTKITRLQKLNIWVNTFTGGIKWIDNIMSQLEFFRENPEFHYLVLENFSKRYFRRILKNSLNSPQREIYNSIRQEFGDNFGEYDVLISQLLTFVNTQQKRIIKLEEKLEASK